MSLEDLLPRSTDQRFLPEPPAPAGAEPIIEAPPHLRRRRQQRSEPLSPPDPAGMPGFSESSAEERYFRAGPAPRRHRRQAASPRFAVPEDANALELPVLFARWHPVPGQHAEQGMT